MTESPKRTWQLVAADLQGPISTGEHILAVIDYKSRYPVIKILDTITSADIVHSFRKIFAAYGYPEIITVDNGTQFNSEELKTFLRKHNHIGPAQMERLRDSIAPSVELFNVLLLKVMTGRALSTILSTYIEQNRIQPRK